MSGAFLDGCGAASVLATGGPIAGKAAFIGVFVLLLIWLLVMPRRFYDDGDARLPWWRNARIWAVFVVLVEILVYFRWG